MKNKGQLNGDELRKYNSLIIDQERRMSRLRERVNDMVRKEKFQVKFDKYKKSQRNKVMQYVFVTFKHCETAEYALKIFKRENPVYRCLDSCTGSKKKGKIKPDDRLFLGSELQVEVIPEPDAVQWENLQYSIFDQNVRTCETIMIVFFFIMFAIIFTIYMKGFQVLLN